MLNSLILHCCIGLSLCRYISILLSLILVCSLPLVVIQYPQWGEFAVTGGPPAGQGRQPLRLFTYHCVFGQGRGRAGVHQSLLQHKAPTGYSRRKLNAHCGLVQMGRHGGASGSGHGWCGRSITEDAVTLSSRGT